MRQEVNLYTDQFKPKMVWCSFNQALIVVLISVALMSLYSIDEYKKLTTLTTENARLIKNNEGLVEDDQQPLNLMDKIVEKRTILENQIGVLSADIEKKKQIKGAYESERSMGLASFHQVFLTIARQSNSNLSISEIGIYNGGEEVLVNGMSRTKGDIPAYFQRLKSEESFSLTKFGLLKIERQKNIGLYQFFMKRKNEIEQVNGLTADEYLAEEMSDYNG